jgi:murein DD-endopeptidase MepM/ murein hydrolase activator NlpD
MRGRWSSRSMMVLVAVVLGLAPPGTGTRPCWSPPITGQMTDPFRAPGCLWCPGNRGIEYDVQAGLPVRAVAAGTVTFSGAVAGERYVVVELRSGWRVTYGRVDSTTLRAGDTVAHGSIVARSSDRFYFGLRIDGGYVDPAPYLGVEVGRRRLVPTDGRPARPAPPPSVRCPAARR